MRDVSLLRHYRGHCLGLGLCLSLTGFLPIAGAQAEMLSSGRCSELRGVRDALEAVGVADDMKEGPQWAMANLEADRIDRIKTYILAREQILFRCAGRAPTIAAGMEKLENMPVAKPRYTRRRFPLPVRKPARRARARNADPS